MRKRLTTALAVVLIGALVTAGMLWWRDARTTDLQRATAMAPSNAERLSWTDWAGVRDKVGATLSASSSTNELGRFLDEGYDADLTSTSALLGSAPALHAKYGFSPATADWELFSQSASGAVVMLHLPDSTDFGALEDTLVDLGYTRPSSDTGVWRGGADLMGSIGAELTPELQYIALDADDQLVLTSDTADYLTRAIEDANGDGGVPDELATVADASKEPLSASVYAGDYTCSALAMGQADATDQARAAELVEEAGEVNPITGFAMSVQPNRHVRVVMSFESEDQARTNADSRAVLAAGPAPGQGGDFTERFEVGSVTADGQLVTMDLVPREGSYVLSDLSTGPVLFATC